MKPAIQEAVDGLYDLVYPPKCIICGNLNPHYLCASCIGKIDPVPRPFCMRCGHPTHGITCRTCLGRSRSFTAARALGDYGGVLKQAVHDFKYNGMRALADPLAHQMYLYLTTRCDIPWRRAEIIAPVPIHHTRERVRGYNQSRLLAENLSGMTGIPLDDGAIIRHRRTRPQVELTRKERLINLKSAFSVPEPEHINGKTVLLIDDVATTCSTIRECSRTLISAGAHTVYAICLAFGA